MKYIIITPVKNEEKYIKFTLDSVIAQTILPAKWIIVDDGSSDSTVSIVENYTNKYSWIILLKLNTTNEERMGGSKVVRAFNKGYELILDHDFQMIVKLDGDLILPNDYFRKIIEVFNSDNKIGLAGGLIINKIGEKYIQEGKTDYHIRGAFKAYRIECFEDIGGFKPIWNWDGIDEMEAMYKGWKSKSIDLKVIHLRPTTSAYDLRQHAFKSGYEAYKIRMSFILMLLRTIYNSFKKPFFIGSYHFIRGYISARVLKADFVIDRGLGKFINRFHFQRLLKLLR